MKTKTTKIMVMKTMKKMLISLFALLLLSAQAQGADRQPLAVLVVGVDSWMFGDVIAHIVGEELRRGNSNLVPVTREKFVQNKLKALRRASGGVNRCDVREWANAQGLAEVCLVEAKKGVSGKANTPFSFNNAEQKYSAWRINVAGNSTSCVADFTFNRGGATGEMAAAELTKVAWELVGRLQSSSCAASQHIKCFDWEPEMVWVQGGTFTMGCPESGTKVCTCGSRSDAPKAVSVTLSDFYIGKYEITQSAWTALMGNKLNEGSKYEQDRFTYLRGVGGDLPAYLVSYTEVQAFITALNSLTHKAYQLPTEAEWEYAARGGRFMYKNCPNGCRYSGSDVLGDVGWFGDEADGEVHKVGGKVANELGIYDMSGNVAEWCQDWWSESFSQGTNPTGPEDGTYRILRGGSWYESRCIFSRTQNYPDGITSHHGFRVVLH
ncbi:MAG: formylglycine-generating enzyme family protein [Prevotellaceae bacterium]|nr:formylglycine-generating enzyme family protein [Prevotellaceae bacterium]